MHVEEDTQLVTPVRTGRDDVHDGGHIDEVVLPEEDTGVRFYRARRGALPSEDPVGEDPPRSGVGELRVRAVFLAEKGRARIVWRRLRIRSANRPVCLCAGVATFSKTT